MRSLGHIRARVERLASVCLPSEAETVILHWQDFCPRCPACGADLAADAAARAVTEATAARAGATGPGCSIGPKHW